MILAWLDCRVAGGELLLRIDDLDSTRARPDQSSSSRPVISLMVGSRAATALGVKARETRAR